MKKKDIYIQIITTADKLSVARSISKILLKKKLIACFQIIGPMESIYRWNGKIVKSKEYLCLMKSRECLYREIENTIKEIHNYTTPEIVCFNIENGSKEYLEWIFQSTNKK